MSPDNFFGLKTWVVSAWWPEQSRMAETLANGDVIKVLGDSFRRSGDLGFLTTGIGTPRAALNLGATLAQAAAAGALPRMICFVATAGAYNRQVPLESAHLVTSAGWSDGDLSKNASYLPKVERCEYLQSDLTNPSAGESGCLRALSTPGITLDMQLAGELAELADLENLEIFGVALAANRFAVPWIASLGVSNTVGSSAHEQWKAHHLEASLAAQMLLVENFPEAFAR